MSADIKVQYRQTDDMLIVSPDVGGVVRACSASAGSTPAWPSSTNAATGRAIRRWPTSSATSAGRRGPIIFDDIVDSATTLCSAAKSLSDAGAKEVSAYVIHGVLSGEAVKRVEDSVLKEMVITDSIAASERILPKGKIRVVSCARLVGEAIRRIANEESVSKLFD